MSTPVAKLRLGPLPKTDTQLIAGIERWRRGGVDLGSEIGRTRDAAAN